LRRARAIVVSPSGEELPMGEYRPGHALVFRTRAERLRAIAARLEEQARERATGPEHQFLLGQVLELQTTAQRFEADAALIERAYTMHAGAAGRTVFVVDAPRTDDADARAGRVRLSY
jgi:hypothetical protein